MTGTFPHQDRGYPRFAARMGGAYDVQPVHLNRKFTKQAHRVRVLYKSVWVVKNQNITLQQIVLNAFP